MRVFEADIEAAGTTSFEFVVSGTLQDAYAAAGHVIAERFDGGAFCRGVVELETSEELARASVIATERISRMQTEFPDTANLKTIARLGTVISAIDEKLKDRRTLVRGKDA